MTTEAKSEERMRGMSARIAEVMAECAADGGVGYWKSCSGCHETNEGYETGHYPYSEVFQCHVGSGCSECGGIGVVWEHHTKEGLDWLSRQATEETSPTT